MIHSLWTAADKIMNCNSDVKALYNFLQKFMWSSWEHFLWTCMSQIKQCEIVRRSLSSTFTKGVIMWICKLHIVLLMYQNLEWLSDLSASKRLCDATVAITQSCYCVVEKESIAFIQKSAVWVTNGNHSTMHEIRLLAYSLIKVWNWSIWRTRLLFWSRFEDFKGWIFFWETGASSMHSMSSGSSVTNLKYNTKERASGLSKKMRLSVSQSVIFLYPINYNSLRDHGSPTNLHFVWFDWLVWNSASLIAWVGLY